MFGGGLGSQAAGSTVIERPRYNAIISLGLYFGDFSLSAIDRWR